MIKFSAVWIAAWILAEYWLIRAHVLPWHAGLLFQLIGMVLFVPCCGWYLGRRERR